jgi:sRNA-binding protein
MYKEHTLENMFDAIYSDLQTVHNSKQNEAKKNNDTTNPKKSDENPSDNQEFLDILKDKEKSEIVKELTRLTKANLLKITEKLGVKLKKSATKADYINEISNYYAFIQLNKKIGERNE